MSFSLPANCKRRHQDDVRFCAVSDDASARVTELLGQTTAFAVPANSARILAACHGGLTGCSLSIQRGFPRTGSFSPQSGK